MKSFSKIANYVRHAGTSKIVLGSVFVLALAAVVGINTFSYGASANAAARSCTNNDIIRCGTLSAGETVSHIKQNKTGDLPAIYNAYGLQAGDYDRFVKNAKLGYAYKNGNIVVDNEVVATDGFSIGREKKSHDVPVNIAGKTYYGAYSHQVFNSDRIPVLVLFDANGVVEFSVLTACGNPIKGKPKTPSYKCDSLQKTAVSGKKNTYSFKSTATVSPGVKITKVVYDFGDGSAPVTKPNTSEAVTHTYTKPGNHIAKVQIYVTLPGGAQKVLEGPQCTTPVKVEEEKKPVFACEALKVAVISDTQRTFTSGVIAKDGATLAKVVYDFGDGSAPETRTDVNQAVSHTYKPGTYTARVTAHFNVNGKVETNTNDKCKATIQVKEQVKPVFSCDALNATGTGMNRTFTSNVTAKDGATLVNVTYNFGDGSATKTETNPSTPVSHTYKPGTYTARVTAKISVNGQTQDVTNDKCTKPVKVEEVKEPVYECTSLVATTINKEKREYRFTATFVADSGATFQSADFDFGDGQTAKGIQAATSTTVTAPHTFAEAKEYTIVATLNFNVASGVKSDKCEVKISPEKTPPAECPEKPGSGLPVGHPDCKKVEEDCKTNPDKEGCKPQVLPATGPEQMIGGVIGVGSIAAAGYYYFGSRRDLFNTLLNR